MNYTGPKSLVVLAVTLCISGCASHQSMYDTPQDAAGAFVEAFRADNDDELRKVLGPDADEIISSGDAVADRQTRMRFLEAYDQKNKLVTESDGSITLEIGDEDWPLPIPIVKSWGSWRFDAKRGREEVLNRRIGRNERFARQVCLAIVDAQREFESVDRNGDGIREFAQKFVSDPGQYDGLYWETGELDKPSPLGNLAAQAAHEGYSASRTDADEPRPCHGYYYRILTSQGPSAPGGARDYIVNGRMTNGFAIVAWPATYENSGVMTFMVSHRGLVYERDLGTETDTVAREMATFNPDYDWRIEQFAMME